MEVAQVSAANLREPLRLLEEWLREGEPVPAAFAEDLRRRIESGDLEVLAARSENHTVGVLTLAFRPNTSLGAEFASIEDLYVAPEARRQGVGRELLHAADERCKDRGISYLEAQVEGGRAERLYAASGYEPEPDARVFSRSLPLGDKAEG